MAKKDFTEVTTKRGENIEEALLTGIPTRGQQKLPSQEELERRMAEGNTQGRKGCILPRLNVSFTTENLDFLRYGSKANGMSIGKYCNTIIQQFREEHPKQQELADAEKLKQEQNGGRLE